MIFDPNGTPISEIKTHELKMLVHGIKEMAVSARNDVGFVERELHPKGRTLEVKPLDRVDYNLRNIMIHIDKVNALLKL